MPNSDIYTADSGGISVSSSSITPILELRSSGTVSKRAWIVGGRIEVVSATSVAAGNTVTFTLARAGNTPSGGTAVTLEPKDTASGAAISSALIPNWATPPTAGAVLGKWVLPQAAGSMWETYPPLNYEWGLPVATASIAGFVTCSATNATLVSWSWDVSE